MFSWGWWQRFILSLPTFSQKQKKTKTLHLSQRGSLSARQGFNQNWARLFGTTYSQLLKLKFSLPPKVRLKSPFTLVCLIFRHEMRWRWAYHEDNEEMNSGEWLRLGTFTPAHLTVMRPPHHHNPSTPPGTLCNQQKKKKKKHVYVFGLKEG